MSVHTHFYYSNQCKINKHSSLQFHCFNTFDVAPSPGIALVSVCELSGRAVQPTDGGLLPPDVGGARGGGERFDRSLQAVLWQVYAHQDRDPQPDLP